MPPPSHPVSAWYVKAGQKAYGPYSAQRMTAFIHEGRVTAETLVGPSASGPWSEAGADLTLASSLLRRSEGLKLDPARHVDEIEIADMIIHVSYLSGEEARVRETLANLGRWTELMPGLYALRTRKTASTVRNAVARELGSGDRLFIVDSSRHRTAWHNLGPEAEARLRVVWGSALEAEPGERSA